MKLTIYLTEAEKRRLLQGIYDYEVYVEDDSNPYTRRDRRKRLKPLLKIAAMLEAGSERKEKVDGSNI